MKGRGPLFIKGLASLKIKKWGNGRTNSGRTGWKAKRAARYLLGPYNPKAK